MKSYQYAVIAAFLQGAYAQGPACAQSCISNDLNSGASYSSLCGDSNKVSSVNSCIASSSCSDSDKNSVYQFIASACANVGVSMTAGPEATWSATSGSGGWGGFGGPGFGGKSFAASDSSAWSSYTSAHPSGPSASDWSSFTAAYGISRGPWGTGTPTGSGWLTQVTGGPGGPGGFGFGGGHGGWGPGQGGPFGGGNWGSGPLSSGGSWTTGAWTNWWNGNSCPASDWPGWTSGSWSTSAPWTSWSGCSASVTASSVYTTISNGAPYTTTSFGYQVAQAQNSGASASPTRTNGANSLTYAGGAAAAALMGVIAML